MATIKVCNPRDRNQALWLRIDDPVWNTDNLLITFGCEAPPGSPHPGYHWLHLVYRAYSPEDFVKDLFHAGRQSRSAAKTIETFERMAAEHGLYPAERFPQVARHIGKIGLAIGGTAFLYHYLRTLPFRPDGYYDGDALILAIPPIDVYNPQHFQAGGRRLTSNF